mmetsp:Transcript_18832/g.53954  ORF Transcript_18832/g.53954 Transcript_18832/m.53954 type:complete len:202 (+) Transcript_18832:159-764(+)
MAHTHFLNLWRSRGRAAALGQVNNVNVCATHRGEPQPQWIHLQSVTQRLPRCLRHAPQPRFCFGAIRGAKVLGTAAQLQRNGLAHAWCHEQSCSRGSHSMLPKQCCHKLATSRNAPEEHAFRKAVEKLGHAFDISDRLQLCADLAQDPCHPLTAAPSPSATCRPATAASCAVTDGAGCCSTKPCSSRRWGQSRCAMWRFCC